MSYDMRDIGYFYQVSYPVVFSTALKFSSCENNSSPVPDIVIGLLINKVEFGRDIHAKPQI